MKTAFTRLALHNFPDTSRPNVEARPTKMKRREAFWAEIPTALEYFTCKTVPCFSIKCLHLIFVCLWNLTHATMMSFQNKSSHYLQLSRNVWARSESKMSNNYLKIKLAWKDEKVRDKNIIYATCLDFNLGHFTSLFDSDRKRTASCLGPWERGWAKK